MRAFTLFLALSLPGSHFASPLRTPAAQAGKQQARKGGRWYFAENGHAVYCYGPVLTLTQAQGGLQRVATFCQGNQTIVPLKD
jgi:hypothetical protein